METSATCSLCGPIPDYATEYYNLDDSERKLWRQALLLKSHKLHHDDYFVECPECGALFLLENDIASTGSGDYDGLVLTRLRAEDAAVLREILHRAGRAIEDPAGLAGRLLRLPDDVCNVVLIDLWSRDRELARRLLPALAEHYVARGCGWLWGFLMGFTNTPEDATLLLGELDRHAATPGLDHLRALARATVCSICRSIATHATSYPYAPTKFRLDALPRDLATLRRFGASSRTDVWECPECDSLFYWRSEDGLEGNLSRISEPSDKVRACLQSAIDGKAIDSLFRRGGEWERMAFALGMRSGADLVRPLVPRMVGRLASEPERWLHDALCELARDPATAAAVLASIAKLKRTNPLVDSLAARARAN
jgi:hypothetical protein